MLYAYMIKRIHHIWVNNALKPDIIGIRNFHLSSRLLLADKKKSAWSSSMFNLTTDAVSMSKDISRILATLDHDISYLVAPKVFMRNAQRFIQLGPAFVITWDSNPELIVIKLQIGVEEKITKLYDIECDDTCIFMHRPTTDMPKHVNKTQRIVIDKDVRARSSGIKASFLSTKYFPFSMEESDYGRLVEVAIGVQNGFIASKAYVYGKNILIIRTPFENNDRIVTNHVYEIINKPNPEIYDNKDIIPMFYYVDTDEEHNIKRKLDDLLMTFDKSGNFLYYEAQYPNTRMIKKRKPSFPQMKNILTFDIETVNNKGYLEPCAIGFYDGETVRTYIAEENDSNDMFRRLLDDVLVSKYDGYTVYVHNLKGFDGVYLLKYLEASGLDVKASFKDTHELLQIRVSTRASPKNAYMRSKLEDNVKTPIKRVYSIKIRDSMLLLPHNLRSLCKAFGVEVSKSYFPYKFLSRETMDYIGIVPDKQYWDDNVPDEFLKGLKDKEVNEPWSLKDNLKIYLEIDLKCLHDILIKFADTVYRSYQLNITDFSTLPSLSQSIYRTKFYNDEIIACIHGHVHKFIRNAYFGGIVDVIKPRLYEGFLYDVNSLYPHCMTMPMPVGKPVWTTEKDLDKIFGFVKCRITAPEGLKIPVLPHKLDDGSVINPLGSWVGTYFTPELIHARDVYGYKIEVIGGFKFEKGYNVFNDFVNHFFDIKTSEDEDSPGLKLVAKLVLNSCYGKFGAQEYNLETKVMSKDQVDELCKIHKVVDINPIDGTDKEIVTYEIHPDKESCDKYNIDYLLELLKTDDHGYRNNNVSVAVAAATTAYGRICMNTFKDIAGLVYSDTDSIVTQNALPPEYVGPHLGQMKLETIVLRGIFPAPKTYIVIGPDDKIIKRVKGLGPLMNEEGYNELFNNIPQTIVKEYWDRSLTSGTIKIEERPITINAGFNKRRKVINNGVWTDTEPLEVNNGQVLERSDIYTSNKLLCPL